MPVPRNEGSVVPVDTDLMFLPAYKAPRHYLYFGEREDKLICVAELLETNIYSPEKLDAGKKYFWRVDAYVEGQYRKGVVWSFSTKTNTITH